MKKVKTLKQNASIATLVASLLLSSCSLTSPEDNKTEYNNGNNGGSSYVSNDGDNLQRFLSSFIGTAQDGFSFTIDEAECLLGKNFNNVLSIKDPYKASGQFIVNGLSLHEVEFDVNIPIDYNGLLRGLQITLSDEDLYFAIYNKNDTDSYDFKYKVNIAPYDTTNEEGESVDSTTGGIYRYEYGDLDWVIDDILESLSEKFLKVNDENKGSRFTFDTKAVLESMENMEEGTLDGNPYFIWNLPIGDKTFNLGLKAEKGSYQWTGIDFPSKVQGGYYEISSDTKIKASVSLDSGNETVNISAPEDASGYTSLVDSMAIWDKVIDYANAQKFSVVTRGSGLLLKHQEEAFEGDGVFFNTTEINEEAYLSLRADIDVTDNNLESIYADVDYSFAGLHQIINMMINGSPTDAFDEVYAAINDLQKAKTSKTVIDSIMGSLKDLMNGGDSSSKKNKSGGGLAALGGALTDAINAVKNSEGLGNVKDGNYEDIMGAITTFKGSTDNVVITLDLSVFGMKGTVTLDLIGDSSNVSVGYVKFDNVTVEPFSISGEIDVIPYERTPMTDEEKAQYKELRHLESLSDQFVKISDTKQIKLGLEGYVLTRDTTSVITQTTIGNKTSVPNYQGFSFSGDVGINKNTNQSTGAITVVDRKESYVNDHNVKFDITGKEPKDENGDSTQTDEEVYSSSNPSTQWMLFQYDSKNNGTYPSSENRTAPESDTPLKARFAMHSVSGFVDVFKTLFSSNDPRMERIISLITDLFINSVIGDMITGQYYKVLGSDLITYITLGDRQDVFELPATLIGGESDMKITVNYANDVTREDGRIVGGDIESIELEMAIGVSDIYFKIDVLGYEMQEMNWPNITDISAFVNYSSLKTFAEYAVNMFLAGDRVTTSSGKSVIRSAYKIEGTAEADLPVLSDVVINFKVFVRVEGADIRIAAYVNLPINGVLNSRSLTKSGTRYINFLYHTSGNNDGLFLIDRWDDYGDKGKSQTDNDYHYQTRLDVEGFKSDIMGYITKDIFGLNNTVLNLIDSSSSSSSSQSLHGEDLITGFSFNNDLNNPVWNLDLHTAALLHNSVIGDIKLALGGTYANGKKLFNSAKTREAISIANVIKVTFSAEITNFSPDYYYCWDDSIEVPYNINHTTKKVLFVTTDYYETQFHSISNNSFFQDNFLTVNSDGSVTLASSYSSLPLNPTPSNHL